MRRRPNSWASHSAMRPENRWPQAQSPNDGRMDRDRRQQIREAIVRADHAVLLGLLRQEVWPDDSLQLIGEGLPGTLASHHEGPVPAQVCAAAIRVRDWEATNCSPTKSEPTSVRTPRRGCGPCRST